jgi:hypothetical protein
VESASVGATWGATRIPGRRCSVPAAIESLPSIIEPVTMIAVGDVAPAGFEN